MDIKGLAATAINRLGLLDAYGFLRRKLTKSQVTKVLILNAEPTNKGNQAILASTMEAISRFVPEAEFILTGDSEVNTPQVQIKKPAARVAFGQQRKPFRLLVSLLYLTECTAICALQKQEI
jgi:hypothetical protein